MLSAITCAVSIGFVIGWLIIWRMYAEYRMVRKSHDEWIDRVHRCERDGSAIPCPCRWVGLLYWNEERCCDKPYSKIWPKRWCRVFAPWWKPDGFWVNYEQVGQKVKVIEDEAD